MALWSMAFLGSRPLAGLIDGAVADLVSPRVGVLTAAVPWSWAGGPWGRCALTSRSRRFERRPVRLMAGVVYI